MHVNERKHHSKRWKKNTRERTGPMIHNSQFASQLVWQTTCSTSKANRGRRVHLMNMAEPLSFSIYVCVMHMHVHACVPVQCACAKVHFFVSLLNCQQQCGFICVLSIISMFESFQLLWIQLLLPLLWCERVLTFSPSSHPLHETIFPHFATIRISYINQIIVVGFLDCIVVAEIFHSMVFLLFRIFTSI